MSEAYIAYFQRTDGSKIPLLISTDFEQIKTLYRELFPCSSFRYYIADDIPMGLSADPDDEFPFDYPLMAIRVQEPVALYTSSKMFEEAGLMTIGDAVRYFHQCSESGHVTISLTKEEYDAVRVVLRDDFDIELPDLGSSYFKHSE